jgi:hypothetical protein
MMRGRVQQRVRARDCKALKQSGPINFREHKVAAVGWVGRGGVSVGR